MTAGVRSSAGRPTGRIRALAAAIGASWQRFWFAPVQATDLGIARAVFFTVTLALYAGEDFSQWASVSNAFWMPIWIFRHLHLHVASHSTLVVLQFAWKMALLGGALGLFTRASSVVSFLLGFYLLGLPHNFGHTYHFDAVLVFVFGILACSRAGDAWSLDGLVWPQSAGASERAASGEYLWPLRLAWVATSLVFLAAGVSKLRHSGLEWVFSDTMAIFLTKAHYNFSDANPVVNWGLAIAAHPVLARSMAASALAVESLFPLALFSRHARRVLVPATFAMLVSIRVLMGPTFGGFLAVFAFWAPWTAIGTLLAVRWRRGTSLVLIYDGACGMCTRTVAVVRSLDLLERVEVRDALADWPSLLARFPFLSQDACLDEMHVVSKRGEVFRGFRAYRALARVLPAGWLALPFAHLPGVAAAGDAVYRFVATHRSRTCALAPAASRTSTRQGEILGESAANTPPGS